MRATDPGGIYPHTEQTYQVENSIFIANKIPRENYRPSKKTISGKETTEPELYQDIGQQT